MVTQAELEQRLEELEQRPKDLDLINRVALSYFEAPHLVQDKNELFYLEHAYALEKNVKSSHNLAWYLYFETNQQERAIAIQADCLALRPLSYLPYFLYGYMLIEQKDFQQAITLLNTANAKQSNARILHCLGEAYAGQGDFERASALFGDGSKDADDCDLWLYNQAICQYHLGKSDRVCSLLETLEAHLANGSSTVSGYEVAELYCAIEQYEKSYACAVGEGLKSIDLADWLGIAFALWKVNPQHFQENIQAAVLEREQWIHEIETDHSDWQDETADEKQDYLETYRRDVETYQSLPKQFVATQPTLEFPIWTKTCGCLLFDCGRHNNPFQDELA